MAQNDKKFCLTSYLRNFTSYGCGYSYTCVKWWYLQQFFSFFQKSKFYWFLQNSSINAKRKFWGVPHLRRLCVVFLLNYDLFCPNWSYQYLNGKLWPYHLSCFVNSFLYDPANKAWLFEKFIFELEAFYSFKITCILVRQVISLKKNGGVISKIYCLILWSPICTPLILVSASVKMAGTSATVTYNSMRVDTPGELLI